MPPSRGADRIGVSLGSHRPTIILKLPCLVEKKRTKVRSLAVLFSVANWDRSLASPGRKMSSRRSLLLRSPQRLSFPYSKRFMLIRSTRRAVYRKREATTLLKQLSDQSLKDMIFFYG
ncbi:hypothetical protein MTR67_033935 [Solanum verrucosum]|uniref:Uncharacterized protein n=1 Tax=Solanum verrucosum TaxID=315347 RepID=A0AAF0ZJT5_SOLVR|nr:hypothetical protein MTR67_033935 [Solanum verrucosum]